MNPTDLDAFVGTWILTHEGTVYEVGEPPQTGLYRIEPDGERMKFTMEWTDASGKAFDAVYHTVADGVPYPYEATPTISISTSLLDAQTLETTTWMEGKAINSGTRVLSPDGSTMTVTISGEHRGKPYRNVSVYHRAGT